MLGHPFAMPLAFATEAQIAKNGIASLKIIDNHDPAALAKEPSGPGRLNFGIHPGEIGRGKEGRAGKGKRYPVIFATTAPDKGHKAKR